MVYGFYCFTVNLSAGLIARMSHSAQIETESQSQLQPAPVALAPNAGSGIGRLFFQALLANPKIVELLTEAAIGGLKADVSFRDRKTGEIVSTPDFRTRVQTLTMLLAQAEGDPVKRVIHEHTTSGALDVMSALQASPGLLQAVEREVEKAKFRSRKVKVAEPTGET